jgi:hypothetical protein
MANPLSRARRIPSIVIAWSGVTDQLLRTRCISFHALLGALAAACLHCRAASCENLGVVSLPKCLLQPRPRIARSAATLPA